MCVCVCVFYGSMFLTAIGIQMIDWARGGGKMEPEGAALFLGGSISVMSTHES